MRSTLEQRVAWNYKLAIGRGLSSDEARAEAYAKEGLEAPALPRDQADLEDELDDLKYQLSCERKRADATTKRANLLARENARLIVEHAKLVEMSRLRDRHEMEDRSRNATLSTECDRLRHEMRLVREGRRT